MGFTTFSVYPWVIENIANQGEEALHIFQERELKAWKQEFAVGPIRMEISQNLWHTQDSKRYAYALQA